MPSETQLDTTADQLAIQLKVKPALKKDPVHVAGNEEPLTSEKSDRHLQWDEQAIAEHNLLRGTRMKVSSSDFVLYCGFVGSFW